MPNSPATCNSGTKCYGCPPRFDPESGTTLLEPLGREYGFWAGAPSSVFDPASGDFYVYYRQRKPLLAGRGGECGIGRTDGRSFEKVWTASKDEFGANSIEKGSLIRTTEGRWRLYLSYEVGRSYDRNPPTWRIDLLEADSPADFNPALSRPVIDAPMFGYTFVKDPAVIVAGGEYLVYANVGIPQQHHAADERGVIRTAGRGWTSLFRSHDGVRFSSAQMVMSPDGEGWDCFQRRLTAICYVAPCWFAFYDGATQRADSYDEFCGLATTNDLVNFRLLSLDGP